MRRKTRRYFVNLVFFGSALSPIIYLNRHQSNDKTFAWTTIRYKTTPTTLPQARGTCPGLENSSKPALVVSRVAADGDPKWLDRLTNLYHLCIYTADAAASSASPNLQVPANRGHEAMAYLTFLIDNYADIPAAGAVFVHGSRRAWHNDAPDYDNAALLAALNVSAALAPSGYHNLRCDWSASMCEPSYAPPQGSLEVSLSAMLEPWNARAVSDAALPGALVAMSIPRPVARECFWVVLMLFARSAAPSLSFRVTVCGSIPETSMSLCDSGCLMGAMTVVRTRILRGLEMLHRATTALRAESYRIFGTFCFCSRNRVHHLVSRAVSAWSGLIQWHARAPTTAIAVCMDVVILEDVGPLVIAMDSMFYRQIFDFPTTGRPHLRNLPSVDFGFVLGIMPPDPSQRS